jgi:hypothetical protein
MQNISSLKQPLKRALAIISIPFVLSSTGYALFSQQLSVAGDASKPAYSSSQDLSVSYTKAISPQESNWTYSITVNITNNGSTGVTAWLSDFSLPSDYSSVSCTDSSCSQSGNINTAQNSATNATIAPGGTVSYGFTFTTAEPNYRFTSIAVSGTPEITYGTVEGLTVTATAGTTTQSGGIYTTPYSITVSNNSGQEVTGWRILIPWSATNSVSSMEQSVDYTQSASELRIFSTQSLQDNSSHEFNASLSSTDSNWVLDNYVVEGQL